MPCPSPSIKKKSAQYQWICLNCGFLETISQIYIANLSALDSSDMSFHLIFIKVMHTVRSQTALLGLERKTREIPTLDFGSPKPKHSSNPSAISSNIYLFITCLYYPTLILWLQIFSNFFFLTIEDTCLLYHCLPICFAASTLFFKNL